jgi:hypothetical protein
MIAVASTESKDTLFDADETRGIVTGYGFGRTNEASLRCLG